MATQPVTKISEDEYLRLERPAKDRSEYIGGEIFPMPGGSFRHGEVAVNWSAELRSRLRDTGGRVFSSDVRVRTPTTGSYVYPDVSVVEGEPLAHAGSDDILTNPTVIVEVLSPSTSSYDRGKKFELYREIPSLREYVLVHTDTIYVEHFVRQDDGSWIFREYKGDDSLIALNSIHCSVRLSDVYTDLPR